LLCAWALIIASCSHRVTCPTFGSDYHWKAVSVVKNPFAKRHKRGKKTKHDGNYFTVSGKGKKVKYKDAFTKKQKKHARKRLLKDSFGKKWRKQERKLGKKAEKGKKPKNQKEKSRKRWKTLKEKNREKDPFDGKPKKKRQKKKKKKEMGLWPKNTRIQK